MATLLINNVTISPILIISSTNISIHNPNDIEAILLKNLLKINFKNIVYKSYNECKVKWNLISDMTSLNENDLIESLIVHSYNANLKNKNDYLKSLKIFFKLSLLN